MYRRYLKRIIDMGAAGILLIASLPVLLAVTLLLLVVNRGRPFFYQSRPGRNGRIFRLVKFRTMNDARDGEGNLLPDDLRVTRAGKTIRHLSLDEIPQLWNVLRGHMSLVGPRPLLVKYLPLYSPRQSRRHEVRPGITGLAQVRGRNVLSWEDRFRYDVWYVDHLSAGLDLWILKETVRSVIRREGIYPQSGKAMGPFTGTPATKRSTINAT